MKVIAGGDLTLTLHIRETLPMSHHSAGAGFDLLQVLPLELLHRVACEPHHVDDITRFFRHTAWLFFLSWFALIFIKYHNTLPLFNSIIFPSIKHTYRVLRLAASSFILGIKTTDFACALDSCFSGHFGGLPSQTSRSRAVPSCPPGTALL